MGSFNIVGSTGMDALEQVLSMTYDRHRILADNIANIDTPGYQMRDLDTAAFQKELASAITRARRQNPNNPRLVVDDRATAGASSPSHPRPLVFHDGNNRTVEDIMVDMSKNSIQQSQAAALLRNQLNLMRVVISENV